MKNAIFSTAAQNLAIATFALCGHAAMAEVAGNAGPAVPALGGEEVSQGRGLVPSTNNEVADEVIGAAIGLGAAAAQLSDNLIVKGIGLAAPALAPGRGLSQAEKNDENPLLNALGTGLAGGVGGGLLGTIGALAEGAEATFTEAELFALTGGDRAAVASLRALTAPSPSSFSSWVTRGGLVGAGVGAALGYDISGKQADANANEFSLYYPQTTITISIPTFSQAYSTPPYAAAPAHMAPQMIARSQPHALQMITPQNDVDTFVFPVKCVFGSVVAFTLAVTGCEGSGGVVQPAN